MEEIRYERGSGCFSVGSCISGKREFSDTNFEIANLADVSTECFGLHYFRCEVFSRNVTKFSNLKASIRELSFSAMNMAGYSEPLNFQCSVHVR